MSIILDTSNSKIENIKEYVLDIKNFEYDDNKILLSYEIQIAWYNFIKNPSIITAKELFATVKKRKIRIKNKSIKNNYISIAAGGSGSSNTDTIKNSSWRFPIKSLELMKEEYSQIVALDTLHDLTSAKGYTVIERSNWVKRLLPSASKDEIDSFSNRRVAFQKEVWNFIDKRMDLTIPVATNVISSNNLNNLNLQSIISHLESHLKQKEGILTLIIDGLITRTEISVRLAFMAAYILLLINEYTSINPPINERGIPIYKRNTPTNTQIIRIQIIDGSFMNRDGMFLKPFVKRYIWELHDISRTRITLERSDIYPNLFKTYYWPLTYTSVDHVLTLKPWKFPVLIGENQDTTQEISIEKWSIPYPKALFQSLFSKYYTYSRDSPEGQKLDAAIAVNFLRDAHRVDLAARINGIFITTDAGAFRYALWVKKNHTKISNHSILLNIYQNSGHIQSVEQQII
jgi:hypothetical protein